MAVRAKPRSPFGDLLREALEESGVSIRRLSVLLAMDGEQPESKRRLLQRYVSGEVSPGEDARHEIADALGIDRARFAEDKLHEERRARIVNALMPLADELLALATEARVKSGDEA